MKSVTVHGVLALVGLTAAYMVWTSKDDSEADEDSVVVVDCDEERVSKIALTSDEREVVIDIEGEDDERKSWIKSTRKSPAPTTPASASGDAAKGKTQAFAGNARVEEYIESVAPFRAVRRLGEMKKRQLKEAELDKPKTELAVTCGGKTAKFMVGGSTYGAGDKYVREGKDGPVYLVKAAVVRDLESAEFRLMQRDLHRFDKKEVAGVTVKAYGRERKLLQRNRRTPSRAEWVDAKDPDRRNELYGNWFKRLERMRVQEYLAPNKKPPAKSEALLKMTYEDVDGDEIGTLELVREDAEPPVYYARTEATRAWTTIAKSVAEQVEEDLRPVVGLEPLPKPAAPDGGAVADGGTPSAAPASPAPASPATPALPPGHPSVGAPTGGGLAPGHP